MWVSRNLAVKRSPQPKTESQLQMQDGGQNTPCGANCSRNLSLGASDAVQDHQPTRPTRCKNHARWDEDQAQGLSDSLGSFLEYGLPIACEEQHSVVNTSRGERKVK